MYRTLVKILLEIYVLVFCKLYDQDVVARFKEHINSNLSTSLDYADFYSLLRSSSLSMPRNSWIVVRDFLFYLDNFEISD